MTLDTLVGGVFVWAYSLLLLLLHETNDSHFCCDSLNIIRKDVDNPCTLLGWWAGLCAANIPVRFYSPGQTDLSILDWCCRSTHQYPSTITYYQQQSTTITRLIQTDIFQYWTGVVLPPTNTHPPLHTNNYNLLTLTTQLLKLSSIIYCQHVLHRLTDNSRAHPQTKSPCQQHILQDNIFTIHLKPISTNRGFFIVFGWFRINCFVLNLCRFYPREMRRSVCQWL